MKEEVQDTVIRIVADHLGLPASTLGVESHMMDDLGGDSLDHIELIITIEERFEISIPEEVRPKLLRISQVVAFIKNNSPADTVHCAR